MTTKREACGCLVREETDLAGLPSLSQPDKMLFAPSTPSPGPVKIHDLPVIEACKLHKKPYANYTKALKKAIKVFQEAGIAIEMA